MKVKTAELSGKALEYATFCAAYTGAAPTIEKFPEVSAHGITVPGGIVLSYEGAYKFKDYWRPIKNWEQAGMLIDRFDVDISSQYLGYFASAKMGIRSFGDTRQIAICRAVVAAKLGDEVDIPDELMEGQQ